MNRWLIGESVQWLRSGHRVVEADRTSIGRRPPDEAHSRASRSCGERPNLSLVTMGTLVPSTLSMHEVAPHGPSLTCSNVTPKHRVAKALSESYYAI